MSEISAGTLIVGASVAGATVAETLRAEGYRGRITLVGDEVHAPYNRPPLSKQVLTGAWDAHEAVIHDTAALAELGIDFRAGERAASLDLPAKIVRTTDASLAFDRLVIATGARPRRLPGADGLPGVFALRTVDDVLALRDRLTPGARVVVVGGGILGCEVAAAARKAECDVVLVCRTATPRIGNAGALVAEGVDALLREHGVVLRPGTGVVRVAETDAAAPALAVELTDGATIPADVVVAAIGCTPATEWLRGSGLDVADGVLCDASGRAVDDIYAVGDVARWYSAALGAAVRVEHQLTAMEQAQAVARHIAHGTESAPIEPFFWTELFGTRILIHGTPDPDVPLTLLAGSPAEGRFLAASVRNGATRALVAWNMPRELRQERARAMAAAQRTT